MRHTAIRPGFVPAIVTGSAVVFIATGCALTSETVERPPMRSISLEAFSQQPSDTTGTGAVNDRADGQGQNREPVELSAGGADSSGREQFDAAGGAATSSDADANRRLAPGDSVVVDSLIGQINGRPIYAHAFFEPIADQLAAAGRDVRQRRISPNEFIAEVERIVGNQLNEEVLNAVLLAEAESDLSQEQRMGLFAFIEDLQDRKISALGGVEAEARRRLKEDEQLTLEQYLEDEREQTLVQEVMRRKVWPRVIVSWNDVKREYQRRYDEFNPGGTVTLWRIRLRTERDAESIKQLSDRQAAGADFDALVAMVGANQAGELATLELGPGGLPEIELREEFRAQLKGLAQGDTTEPFQYGSNTWWLHIKSIDRPEGRSIYDPEVQRSLTRMLQRQRESHEQNLYLQSLFDQNIWDAQQDMFTRLVDLAIERFGPNQGRSE